MFDFIEAVIFLAWSYKRWARKIVCEGGAYDKAGAERHLAAARREYERRQQ